MKRERTGFSRQFVRTVTVVAGVLATVVSPVAAQGMGGGWEPSLGHLARTGTHLLGIVGGLVIVYLANRIRSETSGSVVATTSTYVIVGTVLFVLVFVGMEANHVLGVDVWYFADGMDLTRTWYMIALAGMMLSYTLGFRALVKEVGA